MLTDQGSGVAKCTATRERSEDLVEYIAYQSFSMPVMGQEAADDLHQRHHEAWQDYQRPPIVRDETHR